MTRELDTDRDRKFVSFVTNKWLVGVLVALVISMGGYIFSGIDRARDVESSRAEAAERRITQLEISSAAAMAEHRAQYNEILRRLDRIEATNYRRLRESP